MSKRVSVPVLILGLVILASGMSHAAWQRTRLFTNPFNYFSTPIALDPSGHPHIVFIDHSDVNDHKVIHSYFDGIAWRQERVDNGLVRPTSGCSLAIDTLGHIHVSYQASIGLLPTLIYAYFDGEQWTRSPLFKGGWASSIAVDGEGRPHIAHIGPQNAPNNYSDDLQYVTHSGTQWTMETIASHGLIFGGTSIALSPSGKVHVSYSDWSLPRKLFWVTNASGVWESTYIGDGWWATLALDSSDNPHIAYCSESTQELKYARLTDSGWTVETIDSARETTSLVLDSLDNPHIAYGWVHPKNFYIHAKYCHFDGTSWKSELIGAKASGWTSMALDRWGLPHVSYYQAWGKRYGKPSLVYAFMAMPDLSGTWAGIATRTSSSGKQKLSAVLRLTNGVTGKSGKCAVAFYLSDDDAFGVGDTRIGKRRKISELTPGQEKDVLFTYQSAASLSGKYLVAVIDSGGAVSEVDEGNNVVIGQIP